jgi:transcriptional regulator with XRE-family HTH domain
MLKPEFAYYLGSRIGFYRTRKGISQERLAELCGVDRNTIIRYEGGQCIPNAFILMKISKTVDMPVDDCVGWITS